MQKKTPANRNVLSSTDIGRCRPTETFGRWPVSALFRKQRFGKWDFDRFPDCRARCSHRSLKSAKQTPGNAPTATAVSTAAPAAVPSATAANAEARKQSLRRRIPTAAAACPSKVCLQAEEPIARRRAMRSSRGGWVENRFIKLRPDNGLTMNMCAVDGLASNGIRPE